MNSDFDSMQSVKLVYETQTHRGWVHSGILTYILCFTVIVMSGVALIVKAAKDHQEQRSAKHHP